MNSTPPQSPQPPLPPPVRLVVGLRSSEPALIDELMGRLALEFGPVLFQSGRVAASAHAKVGAGPAEPDALAEWVALGDPIDPGQLMKVKQHALRVEQLYLNLQGEKRIFLDVAYVDPARVIRATDKDAVHRIYLGAGIYGEVVLHWRPSGGFEPMPWAPAGYLAPEPCRFLGRVREEWIEWLKQAKRPKPPAQSQLEEKLLRNI
jgi:hypothetical protein